MKEAAEQKGTKAERRRRECVLPLIAGALAQDGPPAPEDLKRTNSTPVDTVTVSWVLDQTN